MFPLLRHLAALLLALNVAFAQDVRGRVQGVVTDQTQAVVVGAAVTLVNDNTGIAATAQTGQTGQYIFDFVLPGTYTVSVELQGFRKFVQKNILVQARGDVTVNSMLEAGSTMESITVEASPVAVNFNTSTMALTLDTKMANTLPIIHRNPFLLVSLNPATVIRSSTEQSPFHHWAASQFDVGGNTNTKNDIILDGSPSMTSQKSSYTPPMDAVQEVNLQQNAVDAEFGHSAGGTLSVSMKSGTNDFHGTAYYLGRNPVFNAMADRVTRRENLTRQHVWGGTLGNPIKKNKLFNFFSYEGWRTIEPRSAFNTLPTDRERTGDFSQSIAAAGGPRTIYDPFTTTVSGQTVTRQPFAGNVIPGSRIDPTSRIILGDVWKANSPGTGNNQLNNFVAGFANRFRYWNASNRTDWNVSDKFKVFGRYNQFRTFTEQDDYTGGSVAQPVDGSIRHSLSFSGDAVYTLNANTVINVRGAYNSIIDSFGVPAATMPESGWEKFWPGNAWYKPYSPNWPDIYYPGVTVTQPGSSTVLGRGNYWFQEPNSWNIESKMSKNIGRHYFKVGGEFRHENTVAVRPVTARFAFAPNTTANTFNNPNLSQSGDGWATFLLGAFNQSSDVRSIPLQRPQVEYTGFFFHDDFKLSQKLTLNFGLRYEYFTAMRDPEDRLSRFLDLTSPIPEFQGANAPQIPQAAAALRSAAPVYNGAWVFTDADNRGSWNAPKGIFLPRLGLAWRVDNNTAIRIGFARYSVPATLTDGLNTLGSVPYPGFDAASFGIADLQGVPQQRISNPYPGGLVPVVGKRLGRYNNLGDSTTWYQQDFNPAINDRINFSVQRQLPGRILADITFFMNLGRNQPQGIDLNQVDPRIGYNVGNAVNQSVPNPFFNVLPADKMPGQLRTQRNVNVFQLLRPYPQYGSLVETLRGERGNRYKSLQMQFQRPFANGFNFVIGYNYNRESNEEFYDEQDTFTRNYTWQPAQNARQRFTGAAIYEIPFGKSRKYMSAMHPVADAVLGGWAVSGLFSFNTGLFIRFPGYLVDGDPTLSDPQKDRWFDTSKIKLLPAFTRRQNPLQYPKLTGPRFANIDLTLAKEFPIVERLKFELRMEAYNLMNSFTPDSPELNVNSSNFGKVFRQRPGVFGRQLQFSGRFVF
ncbi:MAG: carboxypeptidase-like regulatory domain-containing protein [Bryobacteraceae bacterium]|nr:carboxypeptidase-like regulatory domain-containing protein [Bryobacteraceae bacterium]